MALLLTGVSFFLLIFVLLSERELQEKGMFARIGRNSYGIYLIHHPIIIFLVPSDLSLSAGSKILAYLITSMILSLILGHNSWRKDRINYLLSIDVGKQTMRKLQH